MKHNEVEEVTERASEELVRAKLIRRSADRDLMQALKSVKDLTTQLSASKKENNDLWDAIKHIVDLIWLPEDVGKTWSQLLPLMPRSFDNFIRRAAKACVQSILVQAWVLWSSTQLERLTEEIEDESVLQAMEEAEDEVENLAEEITKGLDLSGGQPTDEPPQYTS